MFKSFLLAWICKLLLYLFVHGINPICVQKPRCLGDFRTCQALWSQDVCLSSYAQPVSPPPSPPLLLVHFSGYNWNPALMLTSNAFFNFLLAKSAEVILPLKFCILRWPMTIQKLRKILQMKSGAPALHWRSVLADSSFSLGVVGGIGRRIGFYNNKMLNKKCTLTYPFWGRLVAQFCSHNSAHLVLSFDINFFNFYCSCQRKHLICHLYVDL
jgi:hypothetical protein